ncbi:MAG: hypothetical protein KDD60_13000, partial [Bdellovibrionales bacterium]|nr:hypothetical protein [Bdellovibrionales bacterium]
MKLRDIPQSLQQYQVPLRSERSREIIATATLWLGKSETYVVTALHAMRELTKRAEVVLPTDRLDQSAS